MLKERLAIAHQVARQVHEAEAAVDNAIVKLGVLAASLPSAQASAKLSSVVGDKAFLHLQGALAGAFGSRTDLVALHNELDALKAKVGLRNVIVGVGDLAKGVPGTGASLEADEVAAAAQARAA
jgi:hypothetical protein